MNSAQSTDHSSAAVASTLEKNVGFSLVFNASKIRTIREGIANSGHQPRCGNFLTERSRSRTRNARSAIKNSLNTATSYLTTGIRKAWEELGGTTIRRTSKPCIGGATPKRDRAGLVTDDRSVGVAFRLARRRPDQRPTSTPTSWRRPLQTIRMRRCFAPPDVSPGDCTA